MNRFRKSLFLLVVVALAAVNLSLVVAQSDDDDQEVTPSEEITLTREEMNDEEENCATILGQAYVPSGIEEGIVTIPPSTGPAIPGEQFVPGMFDPVTSGRTAVAILVIDEFNKVPSPEFYSLPLAMFSATQDAELQPLMDTGELSHGGQVFNHINALLEPILTSAPDPYEPVPGSDRVEWQDASGNRVVVKMVDALNYNSPTITSEVTTKIAQAITDLNAEGISEFVLNMSFAIVPCAVANDIKATKDAFPTFKQYTEQVALKFPELSAQLLITPAGSSDPLFDMLRLPECSSETFDPETPYYDNLSDAELDVKSQMSLEPPPESGELQEALVALNSICSSITLSHVGAAGNSYLSYPFYPARWVKSVSAFDPPSPKAPYSNFGADVRLEGGWFRLAELNISDGDTNTPVTGVDPIEVYYRGTSFAAPIESICMALGIPDTEPPCISVPPA